MVLPQRIIIKMAIALMMTFLLLGGCGISREARQKATLHLTMGYHHFQRGDPTLALRELLEAEKYNPEDPEIQLALGWAYNAKALFPEAEQHLKRAIELNPKYTEAHNVLGATYLEMKQWDNAIKEFEIVLRDVLYLTPFHAWNNMGLAYYNKGDLPRSIECFTRAITLKPDLGVAYFNLGLAYRDASKTEDAARAFQEVIRLAPQSPHARLAQQYLDGLKKSGR